MSGGLVRLATLNGECFEAELRSVDEYQERDGRLHKFYVTDMVSERGKRLVSVFVSGTLVTTGANYESRAEIVRLNAIRRAFDQAALSFDVAGGFSDTAVPNGCRNPPIHHSQGLLAGLSLPSSRSDEGYSLPHSIR